eukprot:TRINITY_DN16988_c0_g1_i1.p1 TRINITY_DN16988_c0_g1~~TRINITY_DN16988_c0_g1_i1.p1  ORF type:complete len:1974 (-),score=315.34 TRINITY_DN16988_c0_g1_i1:1122-7043(-)
MKSSGKMPNMRPLGRGRGAGSASVALIPAAPLGRRRVIQPPAALSGAENGEGGGAESFELRPALPNHSSPYSMTMKLTENLMRELSKAAQNDVPVQIKFGQSSSDNVIRIGEHDFNFTNLPETGENLCDCYVNQSQGDGGARGDGGENNVLLQVGSVSRKLAVQRPLDDLEKTHWKTRTTEVDRTQKSRKVMVLQKEQALDEGRRGGGPLQSSNPKKRTAQSTALASIPRSDLFSQSKPSRLTGSASTRQAAGALRPSSGPSRNGQDSIIPLGSQSRSAGTRPAPSPPGLSPLQSKPSSSRGASPTSRGPSPAGRAVGSLDRNKISPRPNPTKSELQNILTRMLVENPLGLREKALATATGRKSELIKPILKTIATFVQSPSAVWKLKPEIMEQIRPRPSPNDEGSPHSTLESPRTATDSPATQAATPPDQAAEVTHPEPQLQSPEDPATLSTVKVPPFNLGPPLPSHSEVHLVSANRAQYGQDARLAEESVPTSGARPLASEGEFGRLKEPFQNGVDSDQERNGAGSANVKYISDSHAPEAAAELRYKKSPDGRHAIEKTPSLSLVGSQKDAGEDSAGGNSSSGRSASHSESESGSDSGSGGKSGSDSDDDEESSSSATTSGSSNNSSDEEDEGGRVQSERKDGPDGDNEDRKAKELEEGKEEDDPLIDIDGDGEGDDHGEIGCVAVRAIDDGMTVSGMGGEGAVDSFSPGSKQTRVSSSDETARSEQEECEPLDSRMEERAGEGIEAQDQQERTEVASPVRKGSLNNHETIAAFDHGKAARPDGEGELAAVQCNALAGAEAATIPNATLSSAPLESNLANDHRRREKEKEAEGVGLIPVDEDSARVQASSQRIEMEQVDPAPKARHEEGDTVVKDDGNSKAADALVGVESTSSKGPLKGSKAGGPMTEPRREGQQERNSEEEGLTASAVSMGVTSADVLSKRDEEGDRRSGKEQRASEGRNERTRASDSRDVSGRHLSSDVHSKENREAANGKQRQGPSVKRAKLSTVKVQLQHLEQDNDDEDVTGDAEPLLGSQYRERLESRKKTSKKLDEVALGEKARAIDGGGKRVPKNAGDLGRDGLPADRGTQQAPVQEDVIAVSNTQQQLGMSSQAETESNGGRKSKSRKSGKEDGGAKDKSGAARGPKTDQAAVNNDGSDGTRTLEPTPVDSLSRRDPSKGPSPRPNGLGRLKSLKEGPETARTQLTDTIHKSEDPTRHLTSGEEVPAPVKVSKKRSEDTAAFSASVQNEGSHEVREQRPVAGAVGSQSAAQPKDRSLILKVNGLKEILTLGEGHKVKTPATFGKVGAVAGVPPSNANGVNNSSASDRRGATKASGRSERDTGGRKGINDDKSLQPPREGRENEDEEQRQKGTGAAVAPGDMVAPLDSLGASTKRAGGTEKKNLQTRQASVKEAREDLVDGRKVTRPNGFTPLSLNEELFGCEEESDREDSDEGSRKKPRAGGLENGGGHGPLSVRRSESGRSKSHPKSENKDQEMKGQADTAPLNVVRNRESEQEASGGGRKGLKRKSSEGDVDSPANGHAPSVNPTAKKRSCVTSPPAIVETSPPRFPRKGAGTPKVRLLKEVMSQASQTMSGGDKHELDTDRGLPKSTPTLSSLEESVGRTDNGKSGTVKKNEKSRTARGNAVANGFSTPPAETSGSGILPRSLTARAASNLSGMALSQKLLSKLSSSKSDAAKANATNDHASRDQRTGTNERNGVKSVPGTNSTPLKGAGPEKEMAKSVKSSRPMGAPTFRPSSSSALTPDTMSPSDKTVFPDPGHLSSAKPASAPDGTLETSAPSAALINGVPKPSTLGKRKAEPLPGAIGASDKQGAEHPVDRLPIRAPRSTPAPDPVDDVAAKYNKASPTLRCRIEHPDQFLNYTEEHKEKYPVYEQLFHSLSKNKAHFKGFVDGIAEARAASNDAKRIKLETEMREEFKIVKEDVKRRTHIFQILHREIEVIKQRLKEYQEKHGQG